MIVFSEGVPRSGKSYDAVKFHILPALKKGRHVYFRLNGVWEERERTAEYLGMSLERLESLLHPLAKNEVKETLVAIRDNDTEDWTLPDKFKNALVVIDEVHQFYKGGTREKMEEPEEEFFALHGHVGMDIVIMSQFYKRIHPALRYRIERKSSFQKLSALGKHGEKRYLVRRYQTIEPDRYHLVGSETCSYDEEIWPLYHGIKGGTDGDVEQEVYSAGRTSVWKSMLPRAVLIVPLFLFGAWFLFDFFTGGGADLVGNTHVGPEVAQAPARLAGEVWQQPVQSVATVTADKVQPVDAKAVRLEKMTAEQRYIWELSDAARIRFVGVMKSGAALVGLVEWLDSSLVVKDALTLEQLRELGVTVDLHSYGLRLSVGEEVLIATAWPVERPRRDPSPRLYDTSGGKNRGVSVSEHPDSAAATLGSGTPMGSDWVPPSSGNMVRAMQ